MEQTADAGGDLNDFLGAVDGAVVNVERLGHAAFVEGGTDGFDERVDVFGGKELAMAAEAAGVIDKSDEAGLDGHAVDVNMRAVERVGLPHFVGMRLGKSQTYFIGGFGVGFKKFKLIDQTIEGGAGDLGAVQNALLDAQPGLGPRPYRRRQAHAFLNKR